MNEQRLHWVLVVGVLLTTALLGAAFLLVYQAQVALQAANDHLERRVRLRTTELETAAEQLAESERRWRFLADTMPQLVWTARADGSIESLNRGWRVFLGVATDEEAKQRHATAICPDDAPAMRQEWDAMRRERRTGGGEVRLRRADGAYRWHLWRAHPERDPDGRVVRWVGTSTDIHDHMLAEERLEQRVAERTAELAASEERFRQAFEFAGIGMAIVGLDGRWLRVNKSICDIVGYTDAEMRNRTFQDITHPDDLAADLALLEELVAGKRRFYQMEKRYRHRRGDIVWVHLTVSLVRDAEGRPLNFISQIEDITARKQLEHNLALARDQALEASRLKSEFLATMSHEIRTPMNGVIGMTSLLRDSPLTPAQADYVRIIQSSSEALLTVINQILDYSKLEAGYLELEDTPFNLHRLVGEVVALFRPAAQTKTLLLGEHIDSAVPTWVWGDALRLRQVLLNLLGNALKFTATGEVQVTVSRAGTSAATQPDEPVALRFTVRDTGIGISEDGIRRLFAAFTQVDASTTRRFGGTGLGLAICKRLVERMGGSISVESKPGIGSTFAFTVALRPAASGPTDVTAAERGSVRLPQLALTHPLRVLVAEDNETNQQIAGLLLRRLGYAPHFVDNGAEAVQATAGGDFDVILMDVQMPVLDGCAAARRIRERTGPQPWIIAFTAGAMPEDRARALAAGMDDFVAKPAGGEILAAALVRAHAGLARKGGA